MPSFWTFLGEVTMRALGKGNRAGEKIHLWLIYILGALLLLRIAVKEHEVTWIPITVFVVFVLTCFIGYVWHAYTVYRDEFNKRAKAEKELRGDSEEHRRVVNDEWSKLTPTEKAIVESLITFGPQNANLLAERLPGNLAWGLDQMPRIYAHKCILVLQDDPSNRGSYYRIREELRPYIRPLISAK